MVNSFLQYRESKVVSKASDIAEAIKLYMESGEKRDPDTFVKAVQRHFEDLGDHDFIESTEFSSMIRPMFLTVRLLSNEQVQAVPVEQVHISADPVRNSFIVNGVEFNYKVQYIPVDIKPMIKDLLTNPLSKLSLKERENMKRVAIYFTLSGADDPMVIFENIQRILKNRDPNKRIEYQVKEYAPEIEEFLDWGVLEGFLFDFNEAQNFFVTGVDYSKSLPSLDEIVKKGVDKVNS